MPLPEVVLRERLRNELRACSDYLGTPIQIDERGSFPVVVNMELSRTPGPTVLNGKVVQRFHHRLRLVIGPDYPFTKPTVVWLTPIFHPNIMMPEDGGHVCTKLLEDWSFGSTMITFIKGLESLLINPNPGSPFGTDSCTAAAEYFNSGSSRLPPMVAGPTRRGVRIL